MQTLQDVIDAASTFPEQYGKRQYFLYRDGRVWKAECPIAKEVLADLVGKPEGEAILQSALLAAERLGCSPSDIYNFTGWWDTSPGRSKIEYRDRLRARGYRVP